MVILFLLCNHPPDNEKKINKEIRGTLMWPKICFAREKFMNQISGIIFVEKFLLKTIVVHKIKKKNNAFLFSNGGCDEFLGF